MLSSNNWKELINKQEPKKQRFTIKKLTVGVASVLIGFTFMGASALADDNVTTNNSQNAVTNTAVTGTNNANAQETTATTDNNANSTATASNDAATTNTLNVQQATSTNINASALQENKDETSNTESQAEVNNYADLISALNNKNINTITLTGDINQTGSTGWDNINTNGSARQVTINGQNHSLKLSSHYLWLTASTGTNTTGWHITFENFANIQAANKTYGLLGIDTNDPGKNSVEFKNVTINASSPITSSQANYNVTLTGNNTINGTLTGNNAVAYAHDLEISGTTTADHLSSDKSTTGATIFSVSGNATIDSGAKLIINSSAKNVAGIKFSTPGQLTVQPNANVSMTLGDGQSMAVDNAKEIDLQNGSTLSVDSSMLTTGARASAPVTLDIKGNLGTVDMNIAQDATLSIHRNVTGTSDSPLLSFGPNKGTGDSTDTYNLTVNGGTLDLVDATNSGLWPTTYAGGQYKEGWPGILSMWGTSSQDHVQFNNARLINISRTNATPRGSFLIHLNSAGSRPSSIQINSADTNYVTPITMTSADGSTHTWNIKYLSTVSQGGSWAYSFQKLINNNTDYYFHGSNYMNDSENNSVRGNNEVIVIPAHGETGYTHFSGGKYINNDGQAVSLSDGQNDASQTLNDFINKFSWWSGNVKFGSDLQEVIGTVTYVDDAGKTVANKNGQSSFTLNFQKANGLSAATLDSAINNNIPTNWKLKPGYTLPGAQTDTFNIKVPIVHATQTITPGDPGATPDNTTYKDLFTTRTRTIKVYKTDGTLDHSEKQTVTFGRTGVLNQYTGKIMEGSTGPWYVYNTTAKNLTNDKQGTWDEYSVPTYDGYNLLINGVKSDTASVPAVNTVAPDTNVTVKVTYQAVEDTNVTYQFFDDTDNKDVGTPVVVSGKPGTTQNTGLRIPAGYKLANGQNLPTTVMMPTESGAPIVIHLVHGTKPVKPGDPGVNPNDDKYKEMFTTVTRKIYQTKPNAAEQLIDTQEVHFGRNGIEDLVSGKITTDPDSTWEAGTIQDNKFIAGGSSDFASEPVEQITNYDSYVDGVKTTTVPSASALQNGQPANAADVHITYLESNQTTPIPYDPNSDQMNRYVTRTITVYQTDDATKTIKQTVHFVRGGTGKTAGVKDGKGNISWVEWTATWTVANDDNTSTGKTEGQWKEYDVPAVEGYTSTVDGNDATKVNAQNVNADTPDANVTVAYTTAYDPTDPMINPNKPADKYKNMYAHPTRTIKVVNPLTNETDTYSQVVWFGRTMTISTNPNVGVKYGDWELGKVEGNKFVADPTAPSKWAEFDAPTFTNYTPNIAKVDAQEVNATTQDMQVTITYTANGPVTPTETDAQQYEPSYRNTTVNATDHVDTGAPTFTKGDHQVSAPTGTKFSFSNGNTTMTINDKKNSNPVTATINPTTGAITFTAPDAATEYDVAVTVTYPDASTDLAVAKVFVNKTYDPTKVDPHDPTYQDMFKTVTRTINVENPVTGNVDIHTQQVNFSRSKTIDEVTNEVLSYGAWTPAEGQWAEFDAPEFSGYTPSQAVVAAETVTADTADTTVTVTYKSNNGGNHNPGTNPQPGDHHNPGNNDHHNNGGNTNPGNNGGQPSNTNRGNGNNAGNNTETTVNSHNNAQNNKQALPQTGNTKNAAAVVGLGLASLTALFGLGGRKKKEN